MKKIPPSSYALSMAIAMHAWTAEIAKFQLAHKFSSPGKSKHSKPGKTYRLNSGKKGPFNKSQEMARRVRHATI